MLPDVFTWTVRSSCSACGWGRLDWLSVAEARLAGLPVDEAAKMLGPVESVWQCPSCYECGFFGPTESG